MSLGNLDWLSTWRLCNLIGGLIGFIWLIMKASHSWPRLQPHERAGGAVLMLYVFAAVYATGEAWKQHLEFGMRVPMISLITFSLLLHLTVVTVLERRAR